MSQGLVQGVIIAESLRVCLLTCSSESSHYGANNSNADVPAWALAWALTPSGGQGEGCLRAQIPARAGMSTLLFLAWEHEPESVDLGSETHRCGVFLQCRRTLNNSDHDIIKFNILGGGIVSKTSTVTLNLAVTLVLPEGTEETCVSKQSGIVAILRRASGRQLYFSCVAIGSRNFNHGTNSAPESTNKQKMQNPILGKVSSMLQKRNLLHLRMCGKRLA